MPSISCTFCGSVLKTKDTIPEGKKVKCPKCARPFVVGSGDEPVEESDGTAQTPSDRKPPRSREPMDDDSQADDAKPAGKRKRQADSADDKVETGGKEKPASRGMLLYILLGVGLLGCCCTGIGGGAAAWWFTSGPALDGNWESKDEKGRQDLLILFQPSGKGQYTRAAAQQHFFRWKAVDSRTIELEVTSPGDRLWTNEPKTRFSYSMTGRTLKLTPTEGDRREVQFTKLD